MYLYWMDNSNGQQDETKVKYGCLRMNMVTMENDVHEVISYCLTEWAPGWKIEDNHIDQKFTFKDIYDKNITTDQLHSWSASMDLMDQYQSYIDRETSNVSKIQSFYNCTWPRFGTSCEYSFDFELNKDASLVMNIDNYYRQKVADESLTCYIHLQCDRGSQTFCLDWTEICDGYVDCVNDQIDEAECWQLQLNQCKDDEFRCRNGQCISKNFLLDGSQEYECLDRSDERIVSKLYEYEISVPIMKHEDIACITRYSFNEAKMTSSCRIDRDKILNRMFYQDIPNSLTSDCWFAFLCDQSFLSITNHRCLNACPDYNCIATINQTCPPLIVTPASPISFGHIHIAYMKKDIKDDWSEPTPYICYDENRCGSSYSDHTGILHNNQLCRNAKDLSINFFSGGRLSIVTSYLIATHWYLYQCNTILYNNRSVCDHQIMYQCQNSSICITKDRLCDDLKDCEYGDDELCTLANGTCTLESFTEFFKCFSTQICISMKRVGNHRCDCEYYLDSPTQMQCEDENFDACRENQFHLCVGPAYGNFVRRHISFYTICDGVSELYPITIDGYNHTDETECQDWLCDNIYTHCDGFWNCPDGSDELDCNQTEVLIECPPYHHPCVLSQTYNLSCLSIDKYNDGHIDCVGATDEITLCQSPLEKFYCNDKNEDSCIRVDSFCSMYNQCMYGNNDRICNVSRWADGYFCDTTYSALRSAAEKYLCNQLRYKTKAPLKYFMIDSINIKTPPVNVHQKSLDVFKKGHYPSRCHQGLPIKVWINANRSLPIAVCLCPPTYYGDQCQYQSQRVSLTLKFTTSSHSRQTLFAIVVTLIDNSDRRIIHSYEQFTFLYVKDCHRKFNIYLLYGNRSKNLTTDYFVQIDVYEKVSLTHRASFLKSLKYPFLPVHRIATILNIPHDNKAVSDGCECVHGRCLRYLGDQTMSHFCHCYSGWSGKSCNISHNCDCSSDSFCIGIAIDHRSICACPIHKWGPRCLMTRSVCLSNTDQVCKNNGQCIAHDESENMNRQYFCLCPHGFSGERCEILDSTITVTFDRNVPTSPVVTIHFIETIANGWPKNGSTFETITPHSRSLIIRWARPYHLAFLEMFNQDYYLLLVQTHFNASSSIAKTITIKDRCYRFHELFNETISKQHLLRRIKYYHLACQYHSKLNATCFYDGNYFCYCDRMKKQRVANCFQFNSSLVHDCFGQSSCENGARCLQDRAVCPRTSACVCRPCYHGLRCQFQSNFFGLTLDAILAYHIQSHVSITRQSTFVKMSSILISCVIIIGLINGIFSLIAFNNKSIRNGGCGYYLIGTSIVSVSIMIILALKYWILVAAQMGLIRNPIFLRLQCHSIDFLLYVLLSKERWLSACISIERFYTLRQGPKFDRKKSQAIAKYVIVALLLFVIFSNMHDAIYRSLLYDENDRGKNRIWCIARQTRRIQRLSSFFNLLHFFGPFTVNMICSILFIIRLVQRKTNLQQNRSFFNVFYEQLKKHAHLLVSPIISVILSIPRIILFFKTGCMKSMDNIWLPLAGYLFSYLPSMLTFMTFVLPSKFYKRELTNRLKNYQNIVSTHLKIK